MRDDTRPLLLTDEHIPPHLGAHLIRIGYDVLTVRQTDILKSGDGTSDAAVVERAKALGRVIVTNNRTDFEALHESLLGNHCGIIVCPVECDDDDLKKQAKMIHEAIEACPDVRGQLLRITTVHTNRAALRERRRRAARRQDD
jgi:predicted nuclease of predicted toxin-antitoxin system